MDKRILDDSIKKALDGQRLQDQLKDVRDDFGQHKQEIVSAVEAVEDHAKGNKLMNIIQVSEMAARFSEGRKLEQQADGLKEFLPQQRKHNRGAVESRSRIEGGIKDIKDMLGGDKPKVPNSARLGESFQQLSMGANVGNNRKQLGANNMLASLASGASESPEKLETFAKELQKADNDQRRELLSALNKVSNVAAGKSDSDLKGERAILEKSPILEKAGIAVDTSKPSFIDMLNANEADGGGAVKRNKAFKSFRNMAQEQRMLVPDGILPGTKVDLDVLRSGIDSETMPEKNYEVLVDIYELLEQWHNQMLDGTIGNDGGGGTNIIPGGTRGPKGTRVPRGNAVRTPNPAQGFKHGGQGRVQAKSGRFYNASSPQGKAIIAAKNAPKPAAATVAKPVTTNTAGSVANVADDAAKGGSKLAQGAKALGRNVGKAAGVLALPISAVLETLDAKADIEVAEERAQLGENDEAFLTEEALEREKTAEVVEAGTRLSTGTVGAMAGAKLGAAVGSFAGPVGTVVGGVVGGAAGYLAASEAGEAVAGVAKAWSDDDLQSAQDSGLYDWEGWGNSILDRSKLKDASSPELQAIVRHDDLSDDDMNAVLEELHKRGGTTSLNADQKEEMGLTDGGPVEELAAATTPTADAVGNTTEGFEDAVSESTKTAGVNVNDSSTKITKIEKGEPFAVDTRLSTNDSSQESVLTVLSKTAGYLA